MIETIGDAADFAIRERLAQTGDDLNGYAVYEDPFVADMFRYLAERPPEGARWDVFRRYVYRNHAKWEADLACLPLVTRQAGSTGNPVAVALVEVKLWTENARLEDVAHGFERDVKRLRKKSTGRDGYFVLWAQGDDSANLRQRFLRVERLLQLSNARQGQEIQTNWYVDNTQSTKAVTQAWVWKVDRTEP